VVIVFRRGNKKRKHKAGWFQAAQLEEVVEAALWSEYEFLRVTTVRLRRLASKVAQGELLAHGKIELRATTSQILNELEFIAANDLLDDRLAEGETSPSDCTSSEQDSDDASPLPNAKTPCGHRLQHIWHNLAVGDLVLAAGHDRYGAPDSWHEAIITGRVGDQFVLRWRDYPLDGQVKRSRHHVALLHPVF